MLSSELESCLNQSFLQAAGARHELLSVEHLLLGILDAPTVREVLGGCGADLREHIDVNTLRLLPDEQRPVQPQPSVQRVLQRAAFHMKSKGKKEVGVLDVLVAIFSEKHSAAVVQLARMQVTRIIVVNYMAGLMPPSGKPISREH
jgi:ATP-dependent Clp protease ATP-binding subunit ClpA